MKLDRNTNADGRGKYALILMRALTDTQADAVLDTSTDTVCVGSNQIVRGTESEKDQFFVLKYSDVFAHHALHAYAMAVRAEAEDMPEGDQRRSLMEYAAEVFAESEKARAAGVKIPD